RNRQIVSWTGDVNSNVYLPTLCALSNNPVMPFTGLAGRSNGGVDGSAQPLDNLRQFCLTGHEGWCQQHMVAAAAVHRTTHGVDHQSFGHGGFLDARV